MTNIIHIIDTTTVEVGDFIAWKMEDGREIAGDVREITEDGDFIARTMAYGNKVVTHDMITDIC